MAPPIDGLDNIKMNNKEIECAGVYWIQLAEKRERDHWLLLWPWQCTVRVP
jgi:hypothetical protein